VLATLFTLVMSNVGATVLLVPLAVNIAVAPSANPALFALTVALATSNSFVIPTHQVNALIMGPGGYACGLHARRRHHDGAVPGRDADGVGPALLMSCTQGNAEAVPTCARTPEVPPFIQ
jgi:hypothetical protein